MWRFCSELVQHVVVQFVQMEGQGWAFHVLWSSRWKGKVVNGHCGGAKTAYWELLHLMAAGAELCIAGRETTSTVGKKDLCSVLGSAAKRRNTDNAREEAWALVQKNIFDNFFCSV